MLKFELAATINGNNVSLDLCNNDTFILLEADLGFPEVRKVINEKTNQHGADDWSRYFGTRAVTADVLVKQGALVSFAQALDMVATFTRPDIGVITLTYNLGAGHNDRLMYLRASGASSKTTSYSNREMQLQFTASDPFCYSTATTTSSINPAAFVLSGRSYPLHAGSNRTYPAGTGIGHTATNTGSVDSWPVVTLYGPVTSGASVGNGSTFKAISMPTLVLAVGEYVVLDMKNRTAQYLGAEGSDVYGTIDWSSSEWWSLQQGTNTLYYTGSVTAGAYATIVWKETYLT